MKQKQFCYNNIMLIETTVIMYFLNKALKTEISFLIIYFKVYHKILLYDMCRKI